MAALFLAVSFIHVRNSHYGVNDVTAVGILLVFVYCTVRLLRHPALRWYVLAGFVGGLATSTKYSMGFFFVPILVAHWLAGRGQTQSTWDRSGVMAVVIAGVSGLAGCLLGTPYTVLDFGEFWSDFARQSSFANARWLGQPTDPVPWLYLTILLHGFGVVPLALAMAGLVLAIRSRSSQMRGGRWPTEALVLLAFPVAYLTFLLRKEVFSPRLVLPLVPFCALLAGVGASEAARRLGPRGQSVGLMVLLGVALVQPLVADVRHNRLLLQANTRVLATEWALANLPPGGRVTAELRSVMNESTEGVSYPVRGPVLHIAHFDGSPELDEADDYADRGVRYFVTSSYAYERLLGDPLLLSQRQSGLRYLRLHRSLAEHAELIATYSPGHGRREVPYSQDEIFTPFWNLDQYDRPGPTIRIYALDPQLAGDVADQ